MPRTKQDRAPIFRLFALNWEKKKIKEITGLSERAFFMVKAEYEALPEETKQHIYVEATTEEKAKARIEDYEIIQKWIANMQSERIKSWKNRVRAIRRVWEILDKKNPANWTFEDIKLKAIPKLRVGKRGQKLKSIFPYLIAIRSLRPEFKVGEQAVKTKGEKGKINFEWRAAFKEIVRGNMLNEYFLAAREGSKDPLLDETLVRNHVEWGSREGYTGYSRWSQNEVPESEIGGLLGARWESIDWTDATINVYETKTGGGTMWMGCPMKLFGSTAYDMLKQLWQREGCPAEGRIFNLKPARMGEIYKRIRSHFAAKGYAWAKVIHGHFDRKLHASLLKSAGVPLEIVAGQAPQGVVGVGWEDLSTLQKFYVAFADEEIEKSMSKARSLNL